MLLAGDILLLDFVTPTPPFPPLHPPGCQVHYVFKHSEYCFSEIHYNPTKHWKVMIRVLSLHIKQLLAVTLGEQVFLVPQPPDTVPYLLTENYLVLLCQVQSELLNEENAQSADKFTAGVRKALQVIKLEFSWILTPKIDSMAVCSEPNWIEFHTGGLSSNRLLFEAILGWC